jgi:hypothetical protein
LTYYRSALSLKMLYLSSISSLSESRGALRGLAKADERKKMKREAAVTRILK